MSQQVSPNQKCYNTVFQTVKNNKASLAIISALVTIAALGVLLNYYVPAATEFLETSAGRWSVMGGGIGLVTITIAALCCLGLCEQKKEQKPPVQNVTATNEVENLDNKKQEYQSQLDKAALTGSDNDPSFYSHNLNENNIPELKMNLEKKPDNFASLLNSSTSVINLDSNKLYEIREAKGHYKMMTIQTSIGEREILVRESTSSPGRYYMINQTEKRQIFESMCNFTLPQITQMVRLSIDSNAWGYQVSSLSHLLKHTGIIVFKEETGSDKKYYIIDDHGAIAEVPLNQIVLFGLITRPKNPESSS